jgi:hypothetical protein
MRLQSFACCSMLLAIGLVGLVDNARADFVTNPDGSMIVFGADGHLVKHTEGTPKIKAKPAQLENWTSETVKFRVCGHLKQSDRDICEDITYQPGQSSQLDCKVGPCSVSVHQKSIPPQTVFYQLGMGVTLHNGCIKQLLTNTPRARR